ncbi:AhpD-like protein [Lipomyces arxii]|uniref:AhpD-like protein n=1 Tax=Lipomyces arxii TaxID=56418 RepID=UPI0034CFA0DD
MPSLLTPAILSSFRATPLLASSWYYVAAATFSVCNRPEEIPVIFKYAVEHDARRRLAAPQPTLEETLLNDSLTRPSSPTGSTRSTGSYGPEDESALVDCTDRDPADVAEIVRKTREALLKGCALAGLPKTINSMIQLRNATPHEFRNEVVVRPTLSSEDEQIRGTEFWNQVYGKVSRRVLSQMNTAYPDLAQYAVQHVYSPLLSFTSILSAKETSYVIIACLIPQDVNPQLKGHLKGGLNNGATKEEIMRVRELSIQICTLCGITWKEDVAKL